MTPVRIASVVEGHGEVESVPILLRRYAFEWDPSVAFQALTPVRVSRGKLVKPGELERAVRLASYKAEDCGVLVLIDADDDCPATLGPQLLGRAQAVLNNATVVIAKSEFESWFIAAAGSIAGMRGLRADLATPDHVEENRGAKGWLTDSMADPRNAYSETLDQPALAASFDMAAARTSSASFDKFCRELSALLACSSRIPNSLGESRIEATLRGA